MCDVDSTSKYFELQTCNGHGVCVNNACVCDPGWIGLSYFYQTGIDCDINVRLVIIMSQISNVIGAIAIIFFIRYIFLYLTQYQNQDIELYFILCFLCINIMIMFITTRTCTFQRDSEYCFEHMSARVIGQDPGETVGTSIGIVIAHLGFILFFQIYFKFINSLNYFSSMEAQAKIETSFSNGKLMHHCSVFVFVLVSLLS